MTDSYETITTNVKLRIRELDDERHECALFVNGKCTSIVRRTFLAEAREAVVFDAVAIEQARFDFARLSGDLAKARDEHALTCVELNDQIDKLEMRVLELEDELDARDSVDSEV